MSLSWCSGTICDCKYDGSGHSEELILLISPIKQNTRRWAPPFNTQYFVFGNDWKWRLDYDGFIFSSYQHIADTCQV